MLREPRPVNKVEKVPATQKDPRKGRFQLEKLEQRIAPCQTNPQGTQVGNCSKHGNGGHGGFA